MKRTINYLFAALTLITAASCTKDIQSDELNDGQSELRTIELSFENGGITKVGVSDRTPQWEVGDTIWISNGTSSEVKKLASGDITDNVAKISTSLSGTLYAVYPASAQNGVSAGKIGFKIPTSTDGAFGNAHISVAEGTTSLIFRNVVSILKITTEAATKLVNISSASSIAGEFEVTYNTRNVEAGTTQDKSINITSSAAGEKYVAVASDIAFNALEFTVVGNTKATDWATKKFAQTTTTAVNTLYDIGDVSDWGLTYVTNGSIWAKYSISANMQIRFSMGNLQATVNNLGTPTEWNFANEQYSYIGSSEANTSIGTTAGVVDLFGWSTSSSNYGINAFTDCYSGDFKDWGINAIANGGNTANLWRTMTGDEWEWLLGPSSSPNPGTNCRTSSTINGTTNARYAEVRVCYINGLLIFPDTFTWPYGIPTAQPTTFNDKEPHWNNVHYYSAAQFSVLQSAGCVFLPALGYRYSSYVYLVGSHGNYWTSSPYGGTIYATNLCFDSDYIVNPKDYSIPYFGYSVRLVSSALE